MYGRPALEQGIFIVRVSFLLTQRSPPCWPRSLETLAAPPFPFLSPSIGPPPVVQTMGARLEPAVGALELTGASL